MQVELDRISEIEVLNTRSELVRLGSLFADTPSVVIWLRHFGCSFCLEQVKVLVSALPEIRAAGGQLVLIGHGTPAQALHFQQMKAPGTLVVTDPDRTSYRTLGAHRSVWGILGPGDFASWRRGRRLGIRSEGLQGDALQLGAAMVVVPPGRVLLLHVNSSLGDHPQVDQLVMALQGAGLVASAATGRLA
jgi:peroxiredoxin